MDLEQSLPQYVDDKTDELAAWCTAALRNAASAEDAARQIAARLGAHVVDDITEFGFWAPMLDLPETDGAAYWLEIFRPIEPIDLALERQNIRFQRIRLPLQRSGEFVWAAVVGMNAGQRSVIGDFYQVRYRTLRDDDGKAPSVVRDPLAASVPYGAFAPAELYDVAALFAERSDVGYFQQLLAEAGDGAVPRIGPPLNILQIHPGTASPEQTLAGLTRIYANLGDKMAREEALTPAEQHFIGYDAVQLTPVEPGIEFESGLGFWQLVEDHPDSNLVTVNLQRPNMTNWGYDGILVGAATVNPGLLESKRPDELLDLIETLHGFPGGPMRVVLDINLGHLDNQALALLDQRYFAGPTRYGQRVNVRQPVVRALLVELVQRKLRFGVDGLRIDEAQELRWWNPATQRYQTDNELLALLNTIEPEVDGIRYRPWMVFEDGRPWPREDSELASTYSTVSDRYPNVWQLGPLSVEGNIPYGLTYWLNKWWRVEEIASMGRQWITGLANHDTLRRATQLDPETPVNGWLGSSLTEIFYRGFDNAAVWLLTYTMLPGVPMDFINSSLRAPWTFIRNTDDRYSVKIVAEEAYFVDWAISETEFDRDDALRRLKALGFGTRRDLQRFMHVLHHVVQATEYDLTSIVELLNAVEPPLAGPGIAENSLKMLARAWMDDLYDFCNIWRYAEQVEPTRSDFKLATRHFRHAHPWLTENLGPRDRLAYLTPCDGTVLVYGMRHAPDDTLATLFVANMEGAPRTITPLALPIDDLPSDGWELALATPGLTIAGAEQELELPNGAGALFMRSRSR